LRHEGWQRSAGQWRAKTDRQLDPHVRTRANKNKAGNEDTQNHYERHAEHQDALSRPPNAGYAAVRHKSKRPGVAIHRTELEQYGRHQHDIVQNGRHENMRALHNARHINEAHENADPEQPEIRWVTAVEGGK
jgi:hypothetical protein